VSMRRLWLTLLCGLLVAPAALAATHATGDGVFELRSGAGVIVLNTSRGTVWGQIDTGKLVVTDPLAGDGVVLVSGAESTRYVAENVTAYTGKDLHFRVTGGKNKLWFKGSGIDLTAVGVGGAQLTGDAFSDPGDYALDSGKWNAVPVVTRTVRFGVTPTTTP
jgi:hypothetical protein